MENDSDDIRAIGKRMMGDFGSPKSSPESSGSKGMFEMPSFGGNQEQVKAFEMPNFDGVGEAKPQAKQGCSCGHDTPVEQPKTNNIFGNFGGGSHKERKSADEMFGGGFGGMGSNDDAEKLKKLGQSMMGQ